MNVRVFLSLALCFFLLTAYMIPAAAEAQSTTAAALQNEDANQALNDSSETEADESLWDGIVSSIMELFSDDSEELEGDDDQNPDAKEDKSVPGDRDSMPDHKAADSEQHQFVARGSDATPSQPHRRLNPRRASVQANNVTPSHVYQATVDLISEIELVRKAMNVTDSPVQITLREFQEPIHAYIKCLEVMDKTARFQRRLGMIPVDVNSPPAKLVTQSDVHSIVQAITDELLRVKRQMVITSEIQSAPFVGGKSPSLVYENLARASLLLDGLAGRPTTPNDVYIHVMRVHDEMEFIASELSIPFEGDPPAVESGKKPMAVAQQIVRATYKMIGLQTRLGMQATSVPDFSLEQVTAADLHDATNFLLAETVRIREHLNVRSPSSERREARDKTTSDVFARILLVIRNLDIMSKAAEGTS